MVEIIAKWDSWFQVLFVGLGMFLIAALCLKFMETVTIIVRGHSPEQPDTKEQK